MLPEGSGILFKLQAPDLHAENAMAIVSLDGTEIRPATSTGYRYGWHPRMRPTS